VLSKRPTHQGIFLKFSLRYQDVLCTRITRGQTFTCLNEDKRPRAIGNLVTSTPRTPGPYNAEYAKFDEWNQADGLTIYRCHLPNVMFPINNSAHGLNVNQKPNSLENRKKQFVTLLKICHDRDLQAEHRDVHFCQGKYTQLQTNARAKGLKYAQAWNAFQGSDDN
jgi:hypothetical protein